MPPTRSPQRLEQALRQVSEILERQRVLEELTHRQQTSKRELLESLVQRQNQADLANHVRHLHPADLASVLESLPPEERRIVWGTLGPAHAAAVLVELSRVVREGLIEATERPTLLALLRETDPEDLAFLAESLEPEVLSEVYASLDAEGLSRARSTAAYGEDCVGFIMSQELTPMREGVTVAEALEELRQRGELPRQTDSIYVVDPRNVLKGALPLQALVVGRPAQPVAELVVPSLLELAPTQPADEVVKAFERYDLVSAPVVDERGKLVGRVTVDAVMDFARRRLEVQALQSAGLSGEEDLFAPVLASARNRWLWLGINVLTALIASRVIGAFESTINELVALATLLPIVASVGGNTGNQTIALMIRALALDRITDGSVRRLLAKELAVGVFNGLVWGGFLGLVALVLYRSPTLSAVMATAVVLNLMVAALVGVLVPLLLQRAG
ncbi:MAG TPA: magnesium transporter, partial [Vicinamibacteria bacterium]